MSSIEPSIFSDDISQFIRHEYGILLSIGKSDEEAEKMLIEYYSNIIGCNDPDEDVFWIALAYVEWKRGRLSDLVKEKALAASENGLDLKRWEKRGEKVYKERKKKIDKFRAMILSPMPERKKVKKPSVRHCPWREGSLLAYRIINNEKCANSPCFNKYVLLRVVKIYQLPISNYFESEYYNEQMIIALYNWMGSSIPDPDIVKGLRYIPISTFSLFGGLDFDRILDSVDESIYKGISDEAKTRVVEGLRAASKPRVFWCEELDWRPSKYENKDPLTFLCCDDDYEESLPDTVRPSFNEYMLSHFLPFDSRLVRIFEKHIGENRDFEYCII